MYFSSINSINNIASRDTLDRLKNKLERVEAGDEQLMDACKSFEAYMVEQMMQKLEETAHISEDDNAYMEMFKENFIRDKAKIFTENTDLGIAKMLYESMQRTQHKE